MPEQSSPASRQTFRSRSATASSLLLILLLASSCTDGKNTPPVAPELGTANQDDYGKPKSLHIKQVPDDQILIAFGVIADTHIDANNCGDEGHHMAQARKVVHDLNIDCKNAGCLGVLHLGDMTMTHNTQQVVAFRQLYEDSYPGDDGGAIAHCYDDDYTAYSHGDKINFGVFPTIGNHDVSQSDWTKAQDYVRDRVIGADNLLDHYGKDSYVWRWGPYVFFQLGLWAGGFDSDDSGQQDKDKLIWLREALKKHVGNSGRGVFILQHYGFDGFSEQSRWWTDHQRKEELDILCRREHSDDPCVPYNILGILTGHSHAQLVRHAQPGTTAGGDAVSFRNLVFYASGDTGEGDRYCFSILSTAPGSDPNTVRLNVHTKEEKDKHWTTTTYSYPLGVPDEADNFRYSLLRKLALNGANDSSVANEVRDFTGDAELGAGVAVGVGVTVDVGAGVGWPHAASRNAARVRVILKMGESLMLKSGCPFAFAAFS